MSTIPSKRKAPVDKAQQTAEANRRAQEAAARIRAAMASKAANGATPPAARTPNSASPAPASDAIARRLAAINSDLEARRAVPPAESRNGRQPSRGPTPAQETRPAQDTRSVQDVRASLDELKARITPIGERRANVRRPPDRLGPPKPTHEGIVKDGPSVAKSDTVKSPSRESTPADKLPVVPEVTAEDIKKNPYLAGLRHFQPARKYRAFNLDRSGDRKEDQAKFNLRDAIDDIRSRIETTTRGGATDIAVFCEPEPPGEEWWDRGLINQMDGEIDDGLVTSAILHPVIMEPVQTMLFALPESKTYLTKKEIKKKRRVARFYVNQEKQSKIRLGLVPPPEPKIRQANAMKVYPEMAVSNPSLLQKKWQTQVAERKAQHHNDNQARALTKEQRQQKVIDNAEKNASMGVHFAIYRVHLRETELLNKHRFLINTNVGYWLDATGIAIISPSATLIIIEAGEKASKKLRTLLCNRVKWQAIRLGDGDANVGEKVLEQILAQPIEERSLPTECWDAVENRDTTCQLVWQGQLRNRKFKKWGGIRTFDTDEEVQALLAKVELGNVWGALGIKKKEAAPRAAPIRKDILARLDGSARRNRPAKKPAPELQKTNQPSIPHDRALAEWMKASGRKVKDKKRGKLQLDEVGVGNGEREKVDIMEEDE